MRVSIPQLFKCQWLWLQKDSQGFELSRLSRKKWSRSWAERSRPGFAEAAERDVPELLLRHLRHPHSPQDPHPTPEVPGGRKQSLLPPSPLRIPRGDARQLVPRCQIPGPALSPPSQLELVPFQSVAESQSLDWPKPEPLVLRGSGEPQRGRIETVTCQN